MKKILALILAVSFIVLAAACGNTDTTTTESSGTTATTESTASTTTEAVKTTQASATTVATEAPKPVLPTSPSSSATDFDENNIVLSFGAISDVHIPSSNTDDAKNKLTSALAQLRDQAAINDKDGLDAIAIAGDIADTGKKAEVGLFKEFYESVSLPEKTELLLVPGNHDASLFVDDYKNILGEKYFTSDVDESDYWNNSRHCVVNGYHFIFVSPSYYSPEVKYSDDTIKWLDSTLAAITAEDPNAYIFVFTHPMIYGTSYGSELGDFWYTMDLTNTLSKYPQAVTFGGHLHFPLNDERTIMQTSFTSLGCGSVRYLAIEGGFGNMSGTVPPNAYDVSSGLLVQVDANGNVRITRMDFSNQKTFKEPWEISAPNADCTHLDKYTTERGSSANNQAPTLNATAEVKVAGKNASISFGAGDDDDFVHHYKITVKDSTGATVYEMLWLSDFYMKNSKAEMESQYSSIAIGSYNSGTYTAELRAVDSWNAESAPVTAEFTIG